MAQTEDMAALGYDGSVRKRITSKNDEEFYRSYESELTQSENNSPTDENTSKSKTKEGSNINMYFLLIVLVATVLAIVINLKTVKENIKGVITDGDDCSPNPCLNEGVCVDKVDDFSCQCPQWFSGKTCQIDNRPCKNHQCRHGATCVERPDGNYRCVCRPHIAGRFCEILL